MYLGLAHWLCQRTVSTCQVMDYDADHACQETDSCELCTQCFPAVTHCDCDSYAGPSNDYDSFDDLSTDCAVSMTLDHVLAVTDSDDDHDLDTACWTYHFPVYHDAGRHRNNLLRHQVRTCTAPGCSPDHTAVVPAHGESHGQTGRSVHLRRHRRRVVLGHTTHALSSDVLQVPAEVVSRVPVAFPVAVEGVVRTDQTVEHQRSSMKVACQSPAARSAVALIRPAESPVQRFQPASEEVHRLETAEHSALREVRPEVLGELDHCRSRVPAVGSQFQQADLNHQTRTDRYQIPVENQSLAEVVVVVGAGILPAAVVVVEVDSLAVGCWPGEVACRERTVVTQRMAVVVAAAHRGTVCPREPQEAQQEWRESWGQ